MRRGAVSAAASAPRRQVTTGGLAAVGGFRSLCSPLLGPLAASVRPSPRGVSAGGGRVAPVFSGPWLGSADWAVRRGRGQRGGRSSRAGWEAGGVGGAGVGGKGRAAALRHSLAETIPRLLPAAEVSGGEHFRAILPDRGPARRAVRGRGCRRPRRAAPSRLSSAGAGGAGVRGGGARSAARPRPLPGCWGPPR